MAGGDVEAEHKGDRLYLSRVLRGRSGKDDWLKVTGSLLWSGDISEVHLKPFSSIYPILCV